MEQTLNPAQSQSLPSSSPSSSSESTETHPENASRRTSSPAPPLTPAAPSSRLWRPAAQRNLRNQWSNLSTYRQKWPSLSSAALSHASSLVNAHLSQRYMKDMELGVLSNMPNIKQKACQKLFRQQEFHRSKLLSSYKSMVAVLVHMANTCRSMRCYLKGTTSSPLVQFSSCSENNNDSGDGGGVPVFTFWSISVYEKLAQELFQMFAWELNLKRLLVIELLSIRSEEAPEINELHWSDELYPGEFHDLSECNLYSGDPCEPVLPKFEGWKSDTSDQQPHHEVLQVYLTAWLADVNIDKYRVDEIFAVVGEEMHVALS